MIYLKEAYLHYYQASVLSPSYSEVPLELESELVHTYLEKHIERARKDYAASEGKFLNGAVAWEKCQAFMSGELSFLDLSRYLSEALFSELVYSSDETSRDVLVVYYHDVKEAPYLAYLVCKNKACYTHQFIEEEGKSKIALVSNKAILPSESQRLEAYVLVNLVTGELLVCDKAVKIDGDKLNLLSELVFGCTLVPSSKENYRFIKKTVDSICEEYAQDNIEALKRTKTFLEKESRENEKISKEAIASATFPHSSAMQARFKHFAEAQSLPEELNFEHSHIEKLALTQKILTDTGISLEIPLALLDDEESVEFLKESDGTMKILLKGIAKLEGK